jgi:hypothetical protein
MISHVAQFLYFTLSHFIPVGAPILLRNPPITRLMLHRDAYRRHRGLNRVVAARIALGKVLYQVYDNLSFLAIVCVLFGVLLVLAYSCLCPLMD